MKPSGEQTRMKLPSRRRAWTGVVLMIVAELTLFGAAEGPEKWQWIMVGTVPDALLTLGFIFL
jgi:hypothetical protein